MAQSLLDQNENCLKEYIFNSKDLLISVKQKSDVTITIKRGQKLLIFDMVSWRNFLEATREISIVLDLITGNLGRSYTENGYYNSDNTHETLV